MQQITIYFDFISPYAYLGWKAAQRLDATVEARPILFAALLNHWGQLGPAEIAPKRAFTFKDVVRRAVDLGLPIELPVGHPFNPLLPLRLAQRAVAGADQTRVIDACYDAIWVAGVDPTDAAAMAAMLTAAGLDGPGLVARTQDPAVKAALRDGTQSAIDAGVFGVPTFAVETDRGGEHFFGHDRLPDVLRFLDGGDPVTDAQRVGIAELQPLAQRMATPKIDAK